MWVILETTLRVTYFYLELWVRLESGSLELV